MYDAAWGEKIIKDLGVSIWRNEYYAAPTPSNPQDADWNKQRPVVEGIARTARNNNVNLKVVLTVWSPPGDMKCQVTEDVRISTAPWPNGTKGGGTLCVNKYEAFADWLIQGIQMYKDVGVDVYAISPQNEPLFWQQYNSCFYAQQWYADMLKVVGPRVKARFPNVKIFGAENMLEMEAGKDKQWFYNAAIKNTPAALQSLDIFAVHGYSDGIAPTATSQMTKLWEASRQDYVDGAGKPVWMTETSGFVDSWEGQGGKPGALDLGFAIHSALYSGHSSGWIWWQGSADEINEFSLMNGADQLSKRYYVSKHFYRFIRPGAKMVDVQVNQDGVFASAYVHQQMGSFTVVLLNSSNEAKTVRLEGNNIPAQFTQYRSTSTENCEQRGQVSKDSITLPAKSIVTLVNGNVFE